MPKHPVLAVPVEIIEQKIYLIRGQKVMLDSDLAKLYGVAPKRLNEQVKRNRGRFPVDFMFQLTKEETKALRSQIATLKGGRGEHGKYSPYVFTEHGVSMLSAVLNSERAVQMSILIVRAFVKLREILATHKDLAARMEKLEEAQKRHASVINILAQEIAGLKRLPAESKKQRIGFTVQEDEKEKN